ncbi:hypothetical protein Cgig2_019740 [Carnegiea gigantea]|uniref:Uncharacterized protein n=1 Tax=Carnegiea gigantea TaxID=171969 RepID=A0A9Q1KNQ0_9CARY|nr:hypothetical protein Cgig2_019740 [Carnegiea gigantea]
MGNNSSRNDGEGSQQQAQPVLHPQSENTLAQNQPRQTSYARNTNNNCCRTTSSSNNNNNDNNNKNAIKEAKKDAIKLPHNFEAIINDSDSPINRSSPEKLLEQLQAGIFLNGRKMKYWVNEDNINCFLVFAKGLLITWGEDLREEGQITVAVLKNVCWLEMHGRFHTTNLTPGVKYEVAYLIKLEDSSTGWQVPVNFRLTLPNGSKQERKENLNRRPREEWIRIPIGEFETSMENQGEIEFSLHECEGGKWRKGLVIKGVAIEPKM